MLSEREKSERCCQQEMECSPEQGSQGDGKASLMLLRSGEGTRRDKLPVLAPRFLLLDNMAITLRPVAWHPGATRNLSVRC